VDKIVQGLCRGFHVRKLAGVERTYKMKLRCQFMTFWTRIWLGST